MFGQQNKLSGKHKHEDLNWYGVHGVYNMPAFLLAAQYVETQDAHEDYAGNGWSVNGEIRPIKDFGVIGRYDSYDMDNGDEKRRTIVGVTYQYNKNVEFIANYLGEEYNGDKVTDALMLTAEVNW